MKSLVSFPRYEVYKESGVDSIRKIPQHWGIVRFRNFFKFSRGLSITKENLRDEGIPCVSYGEVHSRFGFEVDPQKHELKCVSSDYLLKNKSSLIHQGDIVYADTSEDIEGSGNFTQLVTDDAVFAGYHTIVCRPIEEVNYRYIAYCLESLSFRKQIQKEVKGVKVFSITQAILKNTSIWLPFSEEQKLIATYLDQKTAQIDQAIDIKKKQIELLKERQQVVIQQAVTKGLNPSVKMKDSGIEWIGEVPEHWEVRVLKHLLSEPLKYGANESGYEYHKDLPRYIRITDFSDEGKLSNKNKLSLPWAIGKDFLLRDGDILLARSGATVGKSYQFKRYMSEEKFYCFAGYLIKATADQEIILSDYLNLYLNSDCFLTWRNLIFNRATIENIGADKYAVLPVIVPSVIEQKNILKSIRKQSTVIDNLRAQHLNQIQTLQEYKSSLINSAVTGKIKITPDMIAAEG